MSQLKAVIFLVAACLLSVAAPSQQQEEKAQINILVVRESNGKPVRNAEVVLHLLNKEGKEKQEGLELKTHEDGKAQADGIPYGHWRIQVIASGFRTFGQDYNVEKSQHDITIKLQKPTSQYSIYK